MKHTRVAQIHMIQAYKNKVRYWFAVKFGSLETAYDENVCEVICPECGMKTSINVNKNSEQPCYFCDGDLLSHRQPTIDAQDSVSNTDQATSAPQAQENTDALATAQ